MTQEERNNYFWQQYYGEILATDLPQEYIEQDTRIYCCNEECFVRSNCRLFAEYLRGCKVFGRDVERGCIQDAKGRWKRSPWEKHANDVNYMNASFGMCPEQSGVKPCKYYIKNNNEDASENERGSSE